MKFSIKFRIQYNKQTDLKPKTQPSIIINHQKRQQWYISWTKNVSQNIKKLRFRASKSRQLTGKTTTKLSTTIKEKELMIVKLIIIFPKI